MASRKTNAATQEGRFQIRNTRLCVFHMEGRCRYGTQCGFAHNSGEVKAPPDLTKTSICEKWKHGQCNNTAATCNFAHGFHELRTKPQFVRALEDEKTKHAGRDMAKSERLKDKGHHSLGFLPVITLDIWEESMGAPLLTAVAPPLGLPSTWMSESMNRPMKVTFEESLNHEVQGCMSESMHGPMKVTVEESSNYEFQGSIPLTESSIPFPEKLIRNCTRDYELGGATTTPGSNSDVLRDLACEPSPLMVYRVTI